MPDLEARVDALEVRVDQLAAESRHAADVAVTASREALTARDAHQRNIELLNALRATQAEHSATLAEHSATLAAHGRMHAAHTSRFDALDSALGQLALGMHTIESLLRRLIDSE